MTGLGYIKVVYQELGIYYILLTNMSWLLLCYIPWLLRPSHEMQGPIIDSPVPGNVPFEVKKLQA